MNRTAKRCLSCAVTLLLLGLCLHAAAAVLERKDNSAESELTYADVRLAPFFDSKTPYDVLFMGTSHMIYGVNPMRMWQDEGITSYNLGGNNNTMPIEYWMLKEALEYTAPKLVVIDGFKLLENEKAGPLWTMHLVFDSVPFGFNKLCAVNDLVGTGNEGKDALELLWPFAVYHNRWSELGKGDFSPVIAPLKGGGILQEVAVPADVAPLPRTEKLTENTFGIQYLRRMIEECQNQGIEVLLIYLPFPASEDAQREANTIYDIAQEYDVNYINFLDLDVVNYETDCYDPWSHLNYAGSRKVTDYLARYMREEYDLPDRRKDPAFSDWAKDFAAYQAYLEDVLTRQKKASSYLMMLVNEDWDTVFYLNDTAFARSEPYSALLSELGINTAELADDGAYIIIRTAGHPAEIYREGARPLRTSLGILQFNGDEVLLNGEKCISAPEENADAGCHVTVLDAETGRLLDEAALDCCSNTVLRAATEK